MNHLTKFFHWTKNWAELKKTVGNRKSLEGCYRWMELRSGSDVLNLTPKIYEEWMWYSYSHGVGLLASMEMPTFHFHRQKHGRMLFPCALHAAKPRHVRRFWFRVFQFASSHRFWNKNYGLSMWRPRPRYEWRFVKHQRTDDLPQSVLTVDSHCQSTCKVCVHSSVSLSFHAVQNFLLPDIWFVRLREFLGVKICTAI